MAGPMTQLDRRPSGPNQLTLILKMTDALIQHYLVVLRPRRGIHGQTISSGTREQWVKTRIKPVKYVVYAVET